MAPARRHPVYQRWPFLLREVTHSNVQYMGRSDPCSTWWRRVLTDGCVHWGANAKLLRQAMARTQEHN
eukprot:11386028-Prorocentrum_lima.AAC.1